MDRAKVSKGTKVIAGRTCYLFSAKSDLPGLQTEICHDLQDDILLEQIQTSVSPGGNRTTTVDRITQLNLGVEPEPALMKPPDGFAVKDRPLDRRPPSQTWTNCPEQ